MIARAIVLSFLVALLCLLILSSRLARGLALDLPNERSLHERPVPRTGGIAVLAGAAMALGLGGAAAWLPIALALALAALSLLDELERVVDIEFGIGQILAQQLPDGSRRPHRLR